MMNMNTKEIGSGSSNRKIITEYNNESDYEKVQQQKKRELKQGIRDGTIADPDAKQSIDNAFAIVGTCQEMCPYLERIARAHTKEIDPNEISPDGVFGSSLAVKKYRRAAAGEPEDLPSQVRTPAVLVGTTQYLISLVDQKPMKDVHSFLQNRFRAIRKDFSIQHYKGDEAVYCYEVIARFYLVALHHLASWPGFVANNDREQLTKTLISLYQFYEDRRKEGVAESPNEPEFRAYGIVLNLDDSQMQIKSFPVSIRDHPIVLRAHNLFSLVNRTTIYDEKAARSDVGLNWFLRFFNVVLSYETSYMLTIACIDCINMVRLAGLQAICRGYRVGSQMNDLQMCRDMLGFSEDDDVFEYMAHYGLKISQSGPAGAYLVLHKDGERFLQNADEFHKKPLLRFSHKFERKRGVIDMQRNPIPLGFILTSNMDYYDQVAAQQFNTNMPDLQMDPPYPKRTNISFRSLANVDILDDTTAGMVREVLETRPYHTKVVSNYLDKFKKSKQLDISLMNNIITPIPSTTGQPPRFDVDYLRRKKQEEEAGSESFHSSMLGLNEYGPTTGVAQIYPRTMEYKHPQIDCPFVLEDGDGQPTKQIVPTVSFANAFPDTQKVQAQPSTSGTKAGQPSPFGANSASQIISGRSAAFAVPSSVPSAFAPKANYSQSATFGPSPSAPLTFAPSAFAPSAFAPSAFAPSAFGPSAFAPAASAPDSGFRKPAPFGGTASAMNTSAWPSATAVGVGISPTAASNNAAPLASTLGAPSWSSATFTPGNAGVFGTKNATNEQASNDPGSAEIAKQNRRKLLEKKVEEMKKSQSVQNASEESMSKPWASAEASSSAPPNAPSAVGSSAFAQINSISGGFGAFPKPRSSFIGTSSQPSAFALQNTRPSTLGSQPSPFPGVPNFGTETTSALKNGINVETISMVQASAISNGNTSTPTANTSVSAQSIFANLDPRSNRLSKQASDLSRDNQGAPLSIEFNGAANSTLFNAQPLETFKSSSHNIPKTALGSEPSMDPKSLFPASSQAISVSLPTSSLEPPKSMAFVPNPGLFSNIASQPTSTPDAGESFRSLIPEPPKSTTFTPNPGLFAKATPELPKGTSFTPNPGLFAEATPKLPKVTPFTPNPSLFSQSTTMSAHAASSSLTSSNLFPQNDTALPANPSKPISPDPQVTSPQTNGVQKLETAFPRRPSKLSTVFSADDSIAKSAVVEEISSPEPGTYDWLMDMDDGASSPPAKETVKSSVKPDISDDSVYAVNGTLKYKARTPPKAKAEARRAVFATNMGSVVKSEGKKRRQGKSTLSVGKLAWMPVKLLPGTTMKDTALVARKVWAATPLSDWMDKEVRKVVKDLGLPSSTTFRVEVKNADSALETQQWLETKLRLKDYHEKTTEGPVRISVNPTKKESMEDVGALIFSCSPVGLYGSKSRQLASDRAVLRKHIDRLERSSKLGINLLVFAYTSPADGTRAQQVKAIEKVLSIAKLGPRVVSRKVLLIDSIDDIESLPSELTKFCGNSKLSFDGRRSPKRTLSDIEFSEMDIKSSSTRTLTNGSPPSKRRRAVYKPLQRPNYNYNFGLLPFDISEVSNKLKMTPEPVVAHEERSTGPSLSEMLQAELASLGQDLHKLREKMDEAA